MGLKPNAFVFTINFGAALVRNAGINQTLVLLAFDLLLRTSLLQSTGGGDQYLSAFILVPAFPPAVYSMVLPAAG